MHTLLMILYEWIYFNQNKYVFTKRMSLFVYKIIDSKTNVGGDAFIKHSNWQQNESEWILRGKDWQICLNTKSVNLFSNVGCMHNTLTILSTLVMLNLSKKQYIVYAFPYHLLTLHWHRSSFFRSKGPFYPLYTWCCGTRMVTIHL